MERLQEVQGTSTDRAVTKDQGWQMTEKTNKRIKSFLETLVNQIEENGLMQYDRIHNGEHWVLEEAKELLGLITNEDGNDSREL